MDFLELNHEFESADELHTVLCVATSLIMDGTPLPLWFNAQVQTMLRQPARSRTL